MTNTLHALIDRIPDVTLGHLLIAREVLPFAGLTDCSPIRTQSGIVNTLPLKAIRLLAGGEAKIGGTLASVIFGAARLHFTEEVFLEWLESISRVPYLESELGQLPSTFESIYVRG